MGLIPSVLNAMYSESLLLYSPMLNDSKKGLYFFRITVPTMTVKSFNTHFGLQHSNDTFIGDRTAGGSDGPSHGHFYFLGQLRRGYY